MLQLISHRPTPMQLHIILLVLHACPIIHHLTLRLHLLLVRMIIFCGLLLQIPLFQASSHQFLIFLTVAHIADILAGPIEGLEVDAVAQFDYFAITGIGAVESPGASWQATPSLNDVLEQMARDDFLWEQYPGL